MNHMVNLYDFLKKEEKGKKLHVFNFLWECGKPEIILRGEAHFACFNFYYYWYMIETNTEILILMRDWNSSVYSGNKCTGRYLKCFPITSLLWLICLDSFYIIMPTKMTSYDQLQNHQTGAGTITWCPRCSMTYW